MRFFTKSASHPLFLNQAKMSAKKEAIITTAPISMTYFLLIKNAFPHPQKISSCPHLHLFFVKLASECEII